uniref:ER membrane protein complex subunit 1 n=1 Tax=Albugo laibachii Nc14 TaxID=890382 RepID=F0WWV9_9STRA|nr:conserved hypothetical protein [Albugo laibachii Nc14]|eukprot:CCA25944.1 conserved hypothetical protein [Albugo laibachii Nc14]
MKVTTYVRLLEGLPTIAKTKMNSWRWIFASCALQLLRTDAIYKDQIGELDWFIRNIGRVTQAAFSNPHSSDLSRVFVASDAATNAIASLHTESGDLQWRIKLESADIINAIHHTKFGLVSVSSHSQMIRLWDSDDGSLLWNTFLARDVNSESKESTTRIMETCGHTNSIYLFTTSNYVKVDIQHGTILWKRTYPPHWSNLSAFHLNCAAFKLYIVISDPNEASFTVELDTTTDNVRELDDSSGSPSIVVETMQSGISGRLGVSSQNKEMRIEFSSFSQDPVQSIDISQLTESQRNSFRSIRSHTNKLFLITFDSADQILCSITDNLSLTLLESLPSNGIVSTLQDADSEAVFFISSDSDSITLRPHFLPSNSKQTKNSIPVVVSTYGGSVSQAFTSCHHFKCSHLWRMQDDTILFFKDGQKSISWIREEALASVTQVHWISPIETELEKDYHFSGIPTFTQEIQLELSRFIKFTSGIASFLTNSKQSRTKISKNAHFFGFSKFVVLYTKSGKLFALQPEAQRIVWTKYIGPDYNVFVSRDHPALGLGPELILFLNYRHIIRIDGTTGNQIGKVGLEETYWPLLLPRSHSSVHTVGGRSLALVSPLSLTLKIVEGEAPQSIRENVYFYRFEAEENAFKGFFLNEKHVAKLIWSIVLPVNHKLAGFLDAKHSVIDSSVIVTGDDSLLLKYTNPHTFAFASISKETLAVHLVDGVTGRLVFRAHHNSDSKAISMAQSENWFVYAFWNAERKMTQVASVLFFDGAIGSHELNPWKRPLWTETRSSYDSKLPIVLQRAFLFPARIATLEITRTGRGITPKFLLIGMENGQILKLSMSALDPRQPDGPLTPTQQSGGMQSYSPILPLFTNPTAFVTYNETIASLEGIKACPVELESTTLVIAWGMDVYYHRLAPSKAFDLLPMEFNRHMLILLCVCFILATVASRHFARRKALLYAWK